jgi:aspartate/methionine/tyrosine aminotransferase
VKKKIKMNIFFIKKNYKLCFNSSKNIIKIKQYSTFNKKFWANRIKNFGDTVWTEFTPLANEYKAVNLGQGFPDFGGTHFVLSEAINAIKKDINQYTRSQGHLRLVKALSSYYSNIFERSIDPLSEIVITMGATEGLFASILSFINPGEEVILIEPFYDSYPIDIIIAGGIPKYIPLKPRYEFPNSSNDWILDLQELEKNITSQTKMIILNTPQNVPGKVYSKQELEGIANIAKKYDLIILSDEVYETMVYDNNKHIRIATLPDMFERTITLGSAGKTFSVTGWKTGWVIAPKHLSEAIWITHMNNTFCSTTPLQEAVAIGFEKVISEEKNYFEQMKDFFQKKRDKMCEILKNVNLKPIIPQGSYFVLANTNSIDSKIYFNPQDTSRRDYQFCRWLIKEIGVAAIPPTAFYSHKNAYISENFARFCFCKKDETLEEASKRLQKLKKYQK